MRGGHHDRVKRRRVRQALASVAEHDGRVLDSLLGEVRRGYRGELRIRSMLHTSRASRASSAV